MVSVYKIFNKRYVLSGQLPTEITATDYAGEIAVAPRPRYYSLLSND